VTTPGALVLDGVGVANTQIAASAEGLQSGPGGGVTVKANTLTVEGGARIASTTAGPGKGGDISVSVANGVTLSGPGQITALSTGAATPGDTLSAARLLMNNSASISTEAKGRSAASGAASLPLRDFLYRQQRDLDLGQRPTGNGGNIAIDPQLMILNHSIIKTDDRGPRRQYHDRSVSFPSSDGRGDLGLGISGTIESVRGRRQQRSCCAVDRIAAPPCCGRLRRAGRPTAIEPGRGRAGQFAAGS
jgi:hypothetical protein